MVRKNMTRLVLTLLLAGSLVNLTQPMAISADSSAPASSTSAASPTTDTSSSQSVSEVNRSESQTQPSSTDNAMEPTQADQGNAIAKQVQSRMVRDEIQPPSNANKPSNGGIWIVFTLREGFTIQPQAEQYVVSGTTVNFNLQIAAGFLSSKGVTQQEWKLDASNQWSGPTSSGTKDATGIGQLKSVTFSDNLTEGTYYFQFSYSNWGIFGSTYYTKMAKVVVLPKPVPSTNLAISVTPVVFSTVAYDSKANITPNNSTDLVQWQTGSYKTTYLPANGRQTKFVFDKTYVDPATFVNKDTAVAGYPAKVAAIAGDTSTPSRNSASAPVAVGGLAASRVAQDAGLKWQVSGLSDLQTASESTNPWKYQWQFFDGDGKKLTTPTTAQGVTHTSGTIATIDALNSDQNILTFARDSSFMKDAAAATTKGKPYRAQVTFTTTASDDSKKRADNTITVSSNVAELQVTKPAGKLSLDQVPNFNFGDINVSQVYNGTKNAAKKPEVTSNLAISDTRVGANDWQLTVNMTPYKTVTGTNLVAGNVLRLISDLDTSNTDLIDNNTPVTVATSAKTKPAVWPIKAQLLLNANPNIDIFNHQRFISTVTWNLSSNQVAVPTAQ